MLSFHHREGCNPHVSFSKCRCLGDALAALGLPADRPLNGREQSSVLEHWLGAYDRVKREWAGGNGYVTSYDSASRRLIDPKTFSSAPTSSVEHPPATPHTTTTTTTTTKG